jgi:hypothetical protein
MLPAFVVADIRGFSGFSRQHESPDIAMVGPQCFRRLPSVTSAASKSLALTSHPEEIVSLFVKASFT